MSLPSNPNLLVLRITPDGEHDDSRANKTTKPIETLTSAMSTLRPKFIDLDADVMTEADWDEVLSAIIEYPRNITL